MYLSQNCFYDFNKSGIENRWLNSIVIPTSVNNISGSAFYGCEKLTSAKFENTAGLKAGGDKVSETELKDTAKAAAYLSDEEGLVYHNWVRD